MKGHYMQLIRQRATDQLLFELIYPKKGKQRRNLALVSHIIDRCMAKQWRYGWNACASFALSFPDGERLDASLARNASKQAVFSNTGGLRIPV